MNDDVAIRIPERMFCVLISGKAYSGKTTTVENLAPCLNKVFADESNGEVFFFAGNFGDVLKEECAKKAGVDLALFYTQEDKNTMLPAPFNMTAGRFLQVHGESERTRDPDVWVNHLVHKARVAFTKTSAKYLLMLVGDCRHPNEIESLRKNPNHGFAVRLSGDPSKAIATTTRDMSHISETALDNYEKFDIYFDTDDTPTTSVVSGILNALLEDNCITMAYQGKLPLRSNWHLM